MDNLKITVDEKASPSDLLTLQHGLDRTTPSGIPGYYPRKFSIFARDNDGAVIGGVTGEDLYGYMYLEMLWTSEDHRGKGLGSKLVKAAEVEGKKRGCGYMWVSTFSYQAPEFYAKVGFKEFAKLPDFPKGHERIFLWKSI